jgi:major vault protein
MLGPDFFQDLIIVETSDHARLQLEMSYNWYFKVDYENPEKLFSVSDFVGDACKAVASRVRGAVARVNFDDFHKNSAKLIRASVFGREGKEEFYFPANGLCITGIDVISVDPLDDKTKDALQKAVKIAIAITTQTQQAAAQQQADKIAEKAKGKLRMQELQDEADVENSKKKLEVIRCQTDAVKTTGLKVAEAKSRGEAELIACRADLEVAQLEAETIKISAGAEHMQLEAERGVELELKQNELNIQAEYAEQMSEIETKVNSKAF